MRTHLDTHSHTMSRTTSDTRALVVLARYIARHRTPLEPETLRAHGRKHNLNSFEIGMAVSALRSRGWIHITPNGLINQQS